MKRVGGLFDEIVSWDNIRLGYYKAARGKRTKHAVLAFRRDLDTNLATIRRTLLDPDHAGIGRYRFFTIHDPKERRICEAPFADRVLHHAIMNVLEPHFESFQIHDSYACRTGKGTDAALRRALHFARRYPWVAKCDIRHYFDSIDHGVLKTLLARRFKDARVLRLLSAIVDTYQTTSGRGVPIGNLTSQYFANHYLGYLDHCAKEELQIPGWIRYMDDMLIFDTDKGRVASHAKAVSAYAADRLRLEMKPPVIVPAKQGVPFLGFLIRPGGVYLTRKKRRRAARRIHEYARNFQTGRWSESQLADHLLPVFSHLALARSRTVRNTLIERAGLRQ
jgi:RNA-directed DNA polymerase